MTDGWDKSTKFSPIEIGKKVKENCESFLLTCVNKEGQMKGPDSNYLKEIVKELDTPIIASGGITSIEDIKKLEEIGIFGVVIGMALYKGNINLKQALNI